MKGAAIKGKDMLPIGSISFPLWVAPMRIGNLELNYANMSVFLKIAKF